MSRKTTSGGRLCLLLAAVLVHDACDQVKHAADTIGALISLSNDISARFSEPSVSSTLTNDSLLTIDLVNSKRRSLPEPERRAVALEIARYAYVQLESRDRVSKVDVRFVRRWSVLVFDYNDPSDLFTFDGRDLAEWYRIQAT